MKRREKRFLRLLSAGMASLFVLFSIPMICMETNAMDHSVYSGEFDYFMDFNDLSNGKKVTSAYLSGKLATGNLLSSPSDSSGSYAPTNWKAIEDPSDPGNRYIGLVNPSGFAQLRLLDQGFRLHDEAFEVSFRFCLNESVNATTTLFGWVGKESCILGISGTGLSYADSNGTRHTATVDGGTVSFRLGQWYSLCVRIVPDTGHFMVELDGKKIYDFINTNFKERAASSFLYFCHGWGSVRFDCYLDDISVRSLDREVIEAEERANQEESAKRKDAYVVKEIQDYCRGFRYVAEDAKLGIPVGITTYYKGERSTTATPVIVYVMGYVGAREVATESASTILQDFMDEGYLVVTVDYGGDPRAIQPNLDYSVQTIRAGITNYLYGLSHSKWEVYVVPDGYRIARNIVFYDYRENARAGTIQKIIEYYNTDTKFRTAKKDKIPNYDERVTTIERCLKPDGTPIDLQLRMDIIYPSKPRSEAPVVLKASSNETRGKSLSTKAHLPLDTGPLLRGCAVAIYDHCYTPMSRDDHYGYYGGNFSLQDILGVSYHTTAARCVRYYADEFGYSREDYAVMGLSKASWCGLLANAEPEKLSEHKEGYDQNNGEQAFLAYRDGTPIPSGVSVAFRAMGQGSLWRHDYLDSHNAPTLISNGVQDNVVITYHDWYPEINDYEAAGVDYLSVMMTDLGHATPRGIDPEYQYDRHHAFMDFLMYYLKKDQAPRILYTSAVDGKQVGDIYITRTNIEGTNQYLSHTVTTDNQIFVQFVAPVTEESVKGGITLWDVTENKQVKVSYRKKGNGNRWYLDPEDGVSVGHKYEIRVSASVEGVLSGKTVGEDAVFGFTV